jgi:HD-like signal output (HDOD) protein
MTVPVTSGEALWLECAQQLPAAPRLLAELGRLVRDPVAGAGDVVTLLRRDAAIVSRLLRVANSAAQARAEPVVSVEEAVLAVGFSEVHRVVGALAAEVLSDRPLDLHGVSAAAFRGNALFVATLMEELGARARLDPQACYTAGLLRTIGLPVLARVAERNGAVIPPFAASGEASVAAWERRHWGIDSGGVAARLFEDWHFPAELVAALEHHAEPAGRPEQAVHVLQLAVAVAVRDGYGLPGDPARADEAEVAAAGLTAMQFSSACERAEETFKRLRASVV